MYTNNTETEFIVTVDKEDFGKVTSFLESLDLEDENSDILDVDFYESAWDLQTQEYGHFLIVIGVEKMHLILTKGTHFEKLKEKLFAFISY